MTQAIKFTDKTRMVVALKTGQTIGDIDAQLQVVAEMRSAHGDAFYVFDYETRDGEHVPYALMHQDLFDKHYKFLDPDFNKRFVSVEVLTPV